MAQESTTKTERDNRSKIEQSSLILCKRGTELGCRSGRSTKLKQMCHGSSLLVLYYTSRAFSLGILDSFSSQNEH